MFTETIKVKARGDPCKFSREIKIKILVNMLLVEQSLFVPFFLFFGTVKQFSEGGQFFPHVLHVAVGFINFLSFFCLSLNYGGCFILTLVLAT